jgi:hypothetical protein
MGFATTINSSRYRSWDKDALLADRLIHDNRGKTEALMASQPTNRDLLNLVRRTQ